jgi:hypothetical protein
MDFREFVLLCEIDTTGHYYAVLDPQGRYEISPYFPNAYERDVDLENTKKSRKYLKFWPFEVKSGSSRIDIKGAKKGAYYRIQQAFWDRYGFNRPLASSPEESEGDIMDPNYWKKLAAKRHEVETDIIDPETLDPDYWKKVAAKRRAMQMPQTPIAPSPEKTTAYIPPPT